MRPASCAHSAVQLRFQRGLRHGLPRGKRHPAHIRVRARDPAHVVGQALLPVKARARRGQDRALRVAVHRAPQSLLNALRTAGSPEHLVQPGRSHARDQTPRRFHLDCRHHVVAVPRKLAAVRRQPCFKPRVCVAQVAHQDPRREIGEPAPVHGPEEHPLRTFHDDLRGRVGGLAAANIAGVVFADRVATRLAGMLNAQGTSETQM
jgi:hypothetical protein